MKLPLADGAYQAKSIIASAQRCVNLYSERNPADSVFPSTHYLTPGLSILSQDLSETPVRLNYRASNGEAFTAIGDSIYYVDSTFTKTLLGTITAGRTNPVTMQDNGLVILIGDGTSSLWVIDLATHTMGSVAGSNFYGADRIDYIDTYFVLNRPGTNQWYASLSNADYNLFTSAIGSILTGLITNPGNTGAIISGTITNAGSGYTDGSYTGVTLTGGSGISPASVNLIISAGIVTSVTMNQEGVGFVVGDLVSINTSGLNRQATGTYTFTGNPANGNTIILNGVTWTFVTSGATGDQTNIQGNTADTLTQLAIDLNASANGGIAVATYTVSPTVLTITYDVAGAGGNAYTIAAGTYGGTPSGGTLTGGVTATGSGFVYTVTETSGTYANGTYNNVPLTGGSGLSAEATIVIAGGVVTSVTITNGGYNYLPTDIVSIPAASVGGKGSGFTYTVSTVGGGGFDPLDLATKNGYPDDIASIIVMHREIWLIGTLTSEVWYNTGAADFTFGVLAGTFIEHGTVAKYSIAKQDLSIYWLSQDQQGQAIVMRGTNYTALRISTWAIENTLMEYARTSRIDDAIGMTYQQEGHVFYILTFPTANATWVFDQSNELWHQLAWIDNEGNLNRHRANTIANLYGKIVVGDWENGNLYELSLNNVTDDVDGQGLNSDGTYPITRIRSWPALVNENNRVVYQSFTADMEVGTDNGSVDGSTIENPPKVSLRFSDDRGKTYGNALEQSMGAQGQYLTDISFNRLGMGRGRVFELSWSNPAFTALNGAWINITSASS